MTDHTVTLCTDDTTVDVTLTEPGPLTKMRLATLYPDDFETLSPEILDFVTELIHAVSDADAALVDGLHDDDFYNFIRACSNVATGHSPDFGTDDDPTSIARECFGSIELNDDGSVNIEDWR